MNENSCPLAVLYGYKSGCDELSFVGRNGLICLTGNSHEIDQVLRRCNGTLSIREIALQIPTLTLENTIELVMLLELQGIVCESRELYLRFHVDSANPAVFVHDLGDKEVSSIASLPRLRCRDGKTIGLPASPKSSLLNIVSKRRSTRRFKNVCVLLHHIHGLLRVSYGISDEKHWSVASGGSLYPLDLYLIVLNGQYLQRGVYRWIPEKDSLLVVSEQDPVVWANKAFNAKALLENASCIICTACDFKRPSMKYSNRGYRNVLLEAGHSVQNAYLYCAEHDIGIVEYVGFNEKSLADMLGLGFPKECVISTTVIGYIDESADQTQTDDQVLNESARSLRLQLVGIGKPIERIVFWDPEASGYRMPRWIAMCSYRPPYASASASMRKRCSSFATGLTTSEAAIKCLAEGYERFAWDHYRSDIIESANDLREPYLDPNTVVPYETAQYRFLKDIVPFDPLKKIGWVSGVKLNTGDSVWVPAELVFNPPKKPVGRSDFCLRANSNGIAAHFDRNLATESALYELVERDAFCVMWYSQSSPKKISEDVLPAIITDRMRAWQKIGYNVSVMDITLDGPPVVLVVIWSNKLAPAVISGAGCRSNFDEALCRAFDEAEFMAVTWHGRKLRKGMSFYDIRSPDDHGLYYSDPKNFKHVSWLFKGEYVRRVAKSRGLEPRKLDPIVVDITPLDYKCDLSVVKVLSQHLMPIGFGYGYEHYGHSRLRVLGLDWKIKYPSIPHFFA